VPKSFVGPGNSGWCIRPAGTEPWAPHHRVPENEEDVVYRDPRSGFVAYVPKGSIARARPCHQRRRQTVACDTCHGANCREWASARHLRGRHPTTSFAVVEHAERRPHRPSAALMRPVVEKLSNDDMLAIAAYVLRACLDERYGQFNTTM